MTRSTAPVAVPTLACNASCADAHVAQVCRIYSRLRRRLRANGGLMEGN